MDSFREFPSDFEPGPEPEDTGHSTDVAAMIGTDERRMHVRAYNHWVALLDGRDFPSIEDLEPNDVSDFSGNSVLLDFTGGRDNPAIPYIGAAIRDECGLDDDTRMISDVPSRSLLSRLTDHYMQIIANRAPVGFEAEFINQRNRNICYRGILMPFSSDGDTIDFIYGVINWKSEEGDFAASSAAHAAPDFEQLPIADLPVADASAPHPVVEMAMPPAQLGGDPGLADMLFAARETADAAKAREGRTRAALYQALSLAYDFAVSARSNPQDFEELLVDSGVKAQARAPMTPVVKLVFGADYDKARLTEYAAALSFADRRAVALGGFALLITGEAGGLKALVAAERKARRPDNKTADRGDVARAMLRAAAALSLADLGDRGEFTLLLARRSAAGVYEPVAVVADQAMTERAVRKSG